MSQTSSTSRGRPSTLNQDEVLQVSLMQYWVHDPLAVSINDICKLTGASKPGIYRAFGSDDGLKSAVLDTYQEAAIAPLLSIFKLGQDFEPTVEAVITFMMQDREALGIPNGCLFVMMRSQQHRLGLQTAEKLDQLRQRFLGDISVWVEDVKSKGQLTTDLPTNTAALFIDAQHAGAMRMQREGVDPGHIESFLRFGFGALRS